MSRLPVHIVQRACRLLSAVLLYASLPAQAIPEGPEYPGAEWAQRELQNYARTLAAPAEQAGNPAFLQRLAEQSLANSLSLAARNLADPSWLLVPQLNTPLTPLCTSWALQCAGDPFRYPESPGPDGADFYAQEAEVIPVVYYDRGCARISGRVWAPRGGRNGLPAVVIENGSIQAPETLYWWTAQALVRAGYVVMTFDPRGQGRSDLMTPDFEQGSNFNSAVFWEGLVDAIDFFRSTAVAPYPVNAGCADRYPTAVTPYNPHAGRIDRERLGIAGHSLGARGVSIVQAYGAAGAEPWPGRYDSQNPVDVAVAWDSLGSDVVPRVPALGQTSEYGIGGTAFASPPDAESHKTAYANWVAAGVPVFQLTIQGSTHFEWSLIPTFPATSWCADTGGSQCAGGWGRPLAEHYTLAWFDRWLKRPGEPGYADADARLLADADWQPRYSFYFRSARAFPDRGGGMHFCEDIRAGCSDQAITPERGNASGGRGAVSGGSAGGGCTLAAPGRGGHELALLLGLALLRLLFSVRHWPAARRAVRR